MSYRKEIVRQICLCIYRIVGKVCWTIVYRLVSRFLPYTPIGYRNYKTDDRELNISIPIFPLDPFIVNPLAKRYKVDNHGNLWYGTTTISYPTYPYHTNDIYTSTYVNTFGQECIFNIGDVVTFTRSLIYDGKPVYIDNDYHDKDKRAWLQYGDVKTSKYTLYAQEKLFIHEDQLYSINAYDKTSYVYDWKTNVMKKIPHIDYGEHVYTLCAMGVESPRYTYSTHPDVVYYLKFKELRRDNLSYIDLVVLQDGVILDTVCFMSEDGTNDDCIQLYDQYIVFINIDQTKSKYVYTSIHLPSVVKRMLKLSS